MVLTFVCIVYGVFLLTDKKQRIAVFKYKVYSDNPRTEDSLIQDAVSSVSKGKLGHPIMRCLLYVMYVWKVEESTSSIFFSLVSTKCNIKVKLHLP